MKRNIFFFLSLISALALMSGCSRFDEMNTTTTAVTKDKAGMEQNFARILYKGVYDESQRNFNLNDDLYAYYFSCPVQGWSSVGYAYTDGWASCMWKHHYSQFMQLFYMIDEKCGTEPFYARFKAVNDVFNVFLWARLTDRYGDAPYFGAGKDTTAAFIPQKEIYADMLKRLEEDVKTIADRAGADNFSLSGNYDILYGNDYDKWRKFANSLMLRYATRIAAKDPETAKYYAEKAISGDCFASIDDMAMLPYDATVSGDYYDKTSWDWGQTAPDANFVSVLNGDNPGYKTNVQDPRLSIFFVPANDSIYAGKYVGFPHRMATKDDIGLFRHVVKGDILETTTFAALNEADENGYFYHAAHQLERSNLGFPLMTYSEVLFCQAELALRGILPGSPEDLWKEGIRTSIREAAAQTRTCGVGQVLVSDSQINAYIAALPPFGSDNEQKLRSIIIQKWIALYPNATEGWNEQRRTGYPDFVSGVINYPELDPAALVENGNVIQRISYPDNAYNYDAAHLPADYQPGGSKQRYREQYGVYWSLAGDGGVVKYTDAPKNF